MEQKINGINLDNYPSLFFEKRKNVNKILKNKFKMFKNKHLCDCSSRIPWVSA
ncbi:hypothetical protein Echvi_1418 [Echinicola vietnamensis DSM 17526]|uniref:Uncharacterized protein n=1 Tax=Echinicola vietnamensis (strain DSM 17526 / LMG 23754 / KMM 6221) TaxID=926556 RepID=L0FYG9_ECHVK|nr:hypothetical protein Echvi_1418 [Echinicola vietnamensis DSM 17526]